MCLLDTIKSNWLDWLRKVYGSRRVRYNVHDIRYNLGVILKYFIDYQQLVYTFNESNNDNMICIITYSSFCTNTIPNNLNSSNTFLFSQANVFGNILIKL